MYRNTDSVIVAFDHQTDTGTAVLVVGRKTQGQVTEVINAFAGEEALTLWKKLTEKEKKDGNS